MKRILLLVSFMMTAFYLPAQTEGKKMAALLQHYNEVEKVHPDSMYVHVPMLELLKSKATTPQLRAMYAAALGKNYSNGMDYSQSYTQHTNAPADNMREWSQRDYAVASRRCYSEALSDLELLYQMPIMEWTPIVQPGKDADVFGQNMLYAVWSAMQNDMNSCKTLLDNKNTANREVAKLYPLPSFADMIAFYKEKGKREACFFLEMDSTNEIRSNKIEALQRIANKYADLDVSAKALLEIVTLESYNEQGLAKNREKRYQQLQDILNRYPKCKEAAKIWNEMAELKKTNFCFYPPRTWISGHKTDIKINRRNIDSYSISIYRIPDVIEDEDMEDILDTDDYDLDMEDWNYTKKWLKKHGTLISNTARKNKKGESVFEDYSDTLSIKIKENGRYLIFAKYHTPMTLDEDIVPVLLTDFRATHLIPICTKVANDYKLTVVDAITGTPLQGVEVSVEWSHYNKGETDTLRSTFTTDERGTVMIKDMEDWELATSFHYGDDCYLKNFQIYKHNFQRVENTYEEKIRYSVNTDRGVYRPGQTIQLSGIVYQQQGWEAKTLENQPVKLLIRDSDYEEIIDTTLTTDAFGCVSYSLPLKKAAKLGSYSVQLGKDNRSVKNIKVEEYKRPTFDVQMDEPLLGDSIIFTGRAMTFAGVPVHKARVTGSYQWNRRWWEDYGYGYNEVDTVWTDEKGRFAIRIPKTLSDEELRYGRLLELNVDVLNSNGETQSGEASATLCSTPLRMQSWVQELQDKDNEKPWRFELYDALGRQVEGDVHITLEKGKKKVFCTTMNSQKSETPHGLNEVASGEYRLQAEAVVKGDTARIEQKVVLFSMHDNTLATDTTFWFYAPTEEFSKEHPAQIQIGSSLNDVSLYYILSTEDSIYQDKMEYFSNKLFNITVPYDESMKHGAVFRAFFVKDGKVYYKSKKLKVTQPDYKLKTHWTTFRNKLQPGQHEIWSLSIKRPDGTPANANLLATMYDASLDVLKKNNITNPINRVHNILAPRDFTTPYFETDMLSRHFIELKLKDTYSWQFSTLNQYYFPIKFKQLRLRGVSTTWGAREFEGLAITSVDMALQGRIAGLDIKPNTEFETPAFNNIDRTMSKHKPNDGNKEADAIDGTDETQHTINWSMLRSNFNETAFFYPTLRTNEQGEVTIDFTLPQSLTRWHLLGLAHTHDMLTATLDEDIVAQKSLMAQLHLPRFLRVGDEAILTATLQNIAPKQGESGSAFFEILDEQTEEVLMHQKVQFQLNSLCDTVYHFNYNAVDQHRSLICRWKAEGSTCSDGEQRLLPILSDKQMLTKSKVISLTGRGTTTYKLQTLFPDDATQRRLTVEYTTHPIWCAINALPTLFKPRHDDALCQTATFYAARLSQHLYGKIKPFDTRQEFSTDSLEGIRTLAFSKLKELQNPDGSFSWFPGLTGNSYMTRNVAFQLARLYTMTQDSDEEMKLMIDKALDYIRKNQYSLRKGIYTSDLQYLYIVTMMGKSLNENEKRLLKELTSKNNEWSVADCALACIILHQQDKKHATSRLLDTIKKYLVGNSNTGKYFDYVGGSFTSIDQKIHNHTLVMEALLMASPNDTVLWNDMKQWLLMEKRTTDWGTCTNTLDAIHALLARGTDELSDRNEDVLTIKGKNYNLSLTPPNNAKGYLHSEVGITSPKSITINKKSADTSWGAVYAEFEQQIDSIKGSWQDINIRREMSAPTSSQDGEMHVGDKVYIRYVITAKRDFDYVMLHAPRPASAEPADKLSGCRYSNGLSFYRSIRDNSTDYYIDHLPKGTYVLEEECFIDRNGTYSMGIATIECLYAPEFRAYTGNVKAPPTPEGE